MDLAATRSGEGTAVIIFPPATVSPETTRFMGAVASTSV